MTRYDYFFDAQMKRFLMQVVRAFSGFQYATGRLVNGEPELKLVPCRMAAQNRTVANLLRNGSQNAILAVPMITVAKTGLALDKSRQGNASHIDTLQVVERKLDQNGHYTSDRGQAVTIERLMPRAFNMTVQVDIWTSNLDQQDQLLEQILTITAVPFDIQNSDNPLDWTALTTMELQDIVPTSRSVSIGTEDEIDVSTLTFEIKFWLNPPAKITRQVLINQVNTNVNFDDGSKIQITIAPEDYYIDVKRDVITLLTSDGQCACPRGVVPSWEKFLQEYRTTIIPAQSQIRLRRNPDDDTKDIIGTLQFGPEVNKLYWQVDPDTLPSNTIRPVDAIIRPLSSSPNGALPPAQTGQRYLIYEDLSETIDWGLVNAKANDIIEYRNGRWVIDFDASENTSAYVLNQSTSTQLYWDGEEWQKSIDRIYGPLEWRFFH